MGKREWMGLVVAATLACAGDRGNEGTQTGADTGAAPGVTTPGSTTPGASGPTATAPTPPGGATGPGAASLPPGVTPELIASGKTVFESTAPCYTCHGMDGSGSALAPNLRDTTWVHSDGSLQGIENTVRSGVLQPKQFPSPMPPMGGAQLSNEQVRAVAAYVYSLSHGG